MKIVTVVGARPQFIKAAAGSRAIRKMHTEVLVHTGQHYDSDMSDIFFEEMEIPHPDYHLNIGGGSHACMTGRMLMAIEEVLCRERPDMLLVYGDTNSTLSGALAAVKLNIPVAHVEAGNRLGTLDNPEEVNRKLTDHCSSLLFCASEFALDKLTQEGLSEKAHVVGNIMYDSFLHFADKPWNTYSLTTLDQKNIRIPNKYYYLTCHRQENTKTDETLRQILSAMNQLDAPTIYPVHPRNREQAARLCRNGNFGNIILTRPVKYSDSVHLTLHAQKIVTDSGGLQCEAFFAKVQCLTVFNHVVWPETMVDNRNQLAKPDADDILRKLAKKQSIDLLYQPFGNGHTADKISELMADILIK